MRQHRVNVYLYTVEMGSQDKWAPSKILRASLSSVSQKSDAIEGTLTEKLYFLITLRDKISSPTNT